MNNSIDVKGRTRLLQGDSTSYIGKGRFQYQVGDVSHNLSTYQGADLLILIDGKPCSTLQENVEVLGVITSTVNIEERPVTTL